jgi:hypothetical protein
MQIADPPVKLGFRSFVGTPRPDKVFERRDLVESARKFDTRLSQIPVATLMGTIVPTDYTVACLQCLMPWLSRQRRHQLLVAWRGEAWFAPDHTFVNSLSSRVELHQEQVRDAHRGVAAAPPKPGSLPRGRPRSPGE